MALLTLPLDVVLLVTERITAIDLLNLGQTCKKFREIAAREDVWVRFFCIDDGWARTEYALRGTWKAVYRSWIRETFWLWKAMLFGTDAKAWPTVIGYAPKIRVHITGARGSGMTSLAKHLSPHLTDSLGNRFTLEVPWQLSFGCSPWIGFRAWLWPSRQLREYVISNYAIANSAIGRSGIIIVMFDIRKADGSIQDILASTHASFSDSIDAAFAIATMVDLVSDADHLLESAKARIAKHPPKAAQARLFGDRQTPITWCKLSNKTGEGYQDIAEQIMHAVCRAPRRLLTREEFAERYSRQRRPLPPPPRPFSGVLTCQVANSDFVS